MSQATPIGRELTSSHWGAYEIVRAQGAGSKNEVTGLRAFSEDPSPSPIGLAMWEAYQSPLRIARPAVRSGWLKFGPDDPRRGEGRGREPFVEVPWERAYALVGDELAHTIKYHGNAAIFGGSYGWSSAGRFHHAQSQVRRFLNSLGGFVRSVDSYSLGAGRVLLPHVLAPMEYLLAHQHDWATLASHTRLFLSFGGAPAKNSQIAPGGASSHDLPSGLAALGRAGCKFVNISPVRGDIEVAGSEVEWIPIRPHTDTAVMLALACETLLAEREDTGFLSKYCVGFETWRDYLLGRVDGVRKDAQWASGIADVPAQRLQRLALELSESRHVINVAWSLQRADHGEQPFWTAIGLASLLGQIGLPGGGVALGYGPTNSTGSPGRYLPGPTLPQGQNKVQAFIPVARIADMLLSPGEAFQYNGASHLYPHIRLVYWAGGNPFHHHQDLHRLTRAWRKPQTIIAHEQVWNAHAKMADIVLPATSTLERGDIGHAGRDPLLIAMRQCLAPFGEAQDDYTIFSAVAARLGRAQHFTQGRTSLQWLEHLYAEAAQRMALQGVQLPSFEQFWASGGVRLPKNDRPVVGFEEFRSDPLRHALKTPSGRIEIASERIASFTLQDCLGYPSWFEPQEWLGADLARQYPLHMLSDQPHTKLHSQLDHSKYSLANKISNREPVMMHPADARQRNIHDGEVVRVFNDRGHCLAGVRIDDGLRQGVVKLSTGAWWDTQTPGDPSSLDRHGNPNTLTRDVGASSLSQGCAAQSCLVQIEKFNGPLPKMRAFEPPEFVVE